VTLGVRVSVFLADLTKSSIVEEAIRIGDHEFALSEINSMMKH